MSAGVQAQRPVAVEGRLTPGDGEAVRAGTHYQVHEGFGLTRAAQACLTATPTADPLDRVGTPGARYRAYLACHCWRWEVRGTSALGVLAHGYIVVPTVPA